MIPFHVVNIVACSEAGSVTVLREVVKGLHQKVLVHHLTMRYSVWSASVNAPAPAILTTDTLASICTTPCSVTTGILIGWHIVTSVDGHAHGLVIAFKRVILRTPVAIDIVGIAVVQSPFSRIGTASFISWHIDPVHGSITFTTHIAHINVI